MSSRSYLSYSVPLGQPRPRRGCALYVPYVLSVLSALLAVPAQPAPTAAPPLAAPTLIRPFSLQISDPASSATFLHVAARHIDPVAARDSRGNRVNLAAAARAARDSLVLVQFDAALSPADTAWLNARGARALGHLPEHAAIIDAPPGLLTALRNRRGVRWADAFPPVFRMTERLHLALQRRAPADRILVHVFFITGVALDAASNAVATLADVSELRDDIEGPIITAYILAEQIEALAALPNVFAVDFAAPPEPCNNVATDVTAARPLRDTFGYYGLAETVAVCDTGLDLGVNDSRLHLDFQNGAGQTRVAAIYDLCGDGPSDPHSGHGTHVAGTVLGNGHLSGANPSGNYFPSTCYAGLAPKATLVFQAAGSNNPSFTSLIIPANLNTLFSQAYQAGARIHQNSWGSDLYGDYNSYCRDADWFTFNNPDMLICFSAGNAGTDTNSPYGVIELGLIGAPASAKNVVAVGATENDRPTITSTYGGWWPSKFPYAPINTDPMANNTNGMAAFSSRGPCRDGRRKPDICAPGTMIISPKTHATTSPVLWGDVPGNTNYAYSGGTSMATPVVSGGAALLREFLRVKYNWRYPPAALLKAALLCGAFDMTPGQYGTGAYKEMDAAPNNVEGWGRLALTPILPNGSYYRMGFWTNAFTGPNTMSTNITVVDSSFPLRVILAWTDVAGSLVTPDQTVTRVSGGGLLNDLDLRVIAPNGATNFPAGMNPRCDVFYYTNSSASYYNSPIGMYEAEKCTAPGLPMVITHLYHVLYDATGAGGTFASYIWAPDAAGNPGATLFARTNTVASGAAGWKYYTVALGTPVTITTTNFFTGFQLLTSTIGQMSDYNCTSPRTYYRTGASWSFWGAGDLWLHAVGSVSTGDHINTVEGVLISSPATGTYQIVVSGMNVPYKPARFGLAFSGGFYPAADGDGTWASTTVGGNWSRAAHWNGNIVASGIGKSATFNPASEMSVTVDLAQTIGTINHAGAARLNLRRNGAGPLTLQTAAAQPTVTVANATGVLAAQVALAGSQGFIKRGAGRLALQDNVTNSLSGTILVQEGELRLDNAGASLPNIATILVTNPNCAARLHTETISSTYPYRVPFRLSGLGFTGGTYANFGSLFIYSDALHAAISNVVTTTDNGTRTRFGQYNRNGSLSLWGNISGNGEPEFYATLPSATDPPASFNFYGSNTFATSWVHLSANVGPTIFNLYGHQRFPKTQLNFWANTTGAAILDLRTARQTLTYLYAQGAGVKHIQSTGASGLLTLDNGASGYGLLAVAGTVCIASGTITTPGHAGLNGASVLLVTGGLFHCNNELRLADGAGGGTLTIGGAGVVSNNTLYNGYGFNFGSINLNAGGTLRVGLISSTANGALNFDGGTLSDVGWAGSADWIQGNNSITVRTGGARIEVTSASGRTISKALLDGGGGGGLTKLGTGILSLNANSTYTGPTRVSNGLLRVNGSITASSGLVVAPGATLGGTGLTCAVTVNSNGRLDPGCSIGPLRTGNLTMQAGSRYTWEFTSVTSDWVGAQALSFPGAANSVTVTIKRLDTVTYPVTRTLFTFTSFDPATTNRLYFDLTDPSMSGVQPPKITTSSDAVLIYLIPEPAACGLLLFTALIIRHRS